MLCYAVLYGSALREVMHRHLDQPSDEVIHRQRSQPVIARVAKENIKNASFYNEISNNEMFETFSFCDHHSLKKRHGMCKIPLNTLGNL